jgi:hypothetical protein
VIRFRRLFYGETLTQWDESKRMADNIQQDDHKKDIVKWTIGQSGIFRVKELYLQLRSDGIYPYKFIWKIKMPLKVKVFMWLVSKN